MFKNSTVSTKGKQAALEERKRIQFDERKRKLRLKYKQSKESAENNHENSRKKIKVRYLLFGVATPVTTIVKKCKECLKYKKNNGIRVVQLNEHNFRPKRSLLDKFREFEPVTFVVVNKGILALVFGIVLFRTFLFTWYLIPSESMNPNLKEGDLVFASKLAYNIEIPFTDRTIYLDSPEHGDIVNFFFKDTRFVKRVIAKEGDRVIMATNQFYINGELLPIEKVSNEDVDNNSFISQEYVNYFAFEETNSKGIKYQVMYSNGFKDEYIQKLITDFEEFLVPKDSFFMIGDNRNLSKDSRYIGLIEQKDISSQNLYVIINFYDIWDWLNGRIDSIRFMITL